MAWHEFGSGRVEEVLLTAPGETRSRAVSRLEAIAGDGIAGDRHAGTRLCDARETVLRQVGIAKGMPIANVRQFSAISAEELEEIARAMGLGPHGIEHGMLGENVVVSGLPGLTALPPGTLLAFKGVAPHGAVLAVWGENIPCRKPEANIAPSPGSDTIAPARSFASAAQGRRGVVGFVYAPGTIARGDSVTVWVPR